MCDNRFEDEMERDFREGLASLPTPNLSPGFNHRVMEKVRTRRRWQWMPLAQYRPLIAAGLTSLVVTLALIHLLQQNLGPIADALDPAPSTAGQVRQAPSSDALDRYLSGSEASPAGLHPFRLPHKLTGRDSKTQSPGE